MPIARRFQNLGVSPVEGQHFVEAVLQELRVVSDELRRSIDFVGDTRRELPDRFHLLGVHQFLFEPPALRDVRDVRDKAWPLPYLR